MEMIGFVTRNMGRHELTMAQDQFITTEKTALAVKQVIAQSDTTAHKRHVAAFAQFLSPARANRSKTIDNGPRSTTSRPLELYERATRTHERRFFTKCIVMHNAYATRPAIGEQLHSKEVLLLILPLE